MLSSIVKTPAHILERFPERSLCTRELLGNKRFTRKKQNIVNPPKLGVLDQDSGKRAGWGGGGEASSRGNLFLKKRASYLILGLP